jgi:catechol 2,3-dioxygenase
MQTEFEPVKRGAIAPAAGVGAVHLSVTDGKRAEKFYREMVRLVPLPGRDDGTISLGAAEKELVVLYPDAARPVVPRTTGLYHLAIVVPDRRELARVISRLFEQRYPNSPTDHVMTKSDYLWDPDGTGIEIYAETPEDGTFGFRNGMFYAVDAAGRVRSGRDPIDLDQLFSHLEPDDRLDAPLPEGTKMGHVHLHVRNVDEAVHFYRDLIGFDVMGVADQFGAAFVSAGGYHHHLGLNIWAGEGAPPAPQGSAGLRHFTIELPTKPDLDEVLERLRKTDVEIEEAPLGFFVSDPSRNRVLLAVN